MTDKHTDIRAAHNKNAKQPPQPLRQARMQFELLEARNLMAIVTGSTEESAVMQASQMSAFFQQSALYEDRQPTTSPTVSWINHLERPMYFPRQPDSIELVDRATDEIDSELQEGRTGAFRMLPPGGGARTGGGLRRMIRVDLGWPLHVYAPYVDMTAERMFDLVDAATTQGILYFNLTNISADANGRPCWGGDSTRGVDGGKFDAALREQIHELRALGGDVGVTFGGPLNKSLAEAIENVDELKQAYRAVIDAYGLSRIDFDLSGPLLDNLQAQQRNWQAVGELQRELAELGAPLEVWVTVPATRQGLSQAALEAVRRAGQNGVNLDGVNLKGQFDSPANDPQAAGDGDAVETTRRAYQQLRNLLLPDAETGQVWVKLGVTPVIDGGQAKFTPHDARELYDFAEQQRLGMVSLWTLNGDKQSADQPSASTENKQQAETEGFDISEVFSDFGKLMP
jgi:hypothetical protein